MAGAAILKLDNGGTIAGTGSYTVPAGNDADPPMLEWSGTNLTIVS
jgi:hypothetical protein